ncbi:uncharacterized protein (TIGR03083 family) [Thermomonospora umbrina]|uniref:Uncharacterized protein (TIGR03083 family) n=2 Tax=Thermomonospora umbrina TaxID=111806 RepID=A0A3D9T382_9ACTN|nr:uncharacterized protein (TIGR03083 family) [Thermomonospora umbrina]
MDHVAQFHREVSAFETAVRRAAEADSAALVPSCPGWSVSDLVGHLGGVHRFVAHLVRERIVEQPDALANLVDDSPAAGTDLTFLGLPENLEGWPRPEHAPNRGPVPVGLVDWFGEGARALESLFRGRDPDERVWTWSSDHTVGFWVRMQTIEAALHRWDAENALGAGRPIDAALARDAIGQNFEVMAPYRRARQHAPPGTGERYRFTESDGTHVWTVTFAGDDVRLDGGTGPCDVELAGTAADLLLFLWQRIPADRLRVRGDRGVLDRYFTLVPAV